MWSAYLPPSEAGGPFTLAVSAANTITLRGVMVGEVWVDSGQSNMELSLRGAIGGEAGEDVVHVPLMPWEE